MNEKTRKIAGLTGSALMLASMGTVAAATLAPDSAVAETGVSLPAEEAANSGKVEVAEVVGAFGFSQGEITPTEVIAKAMAKAPQYLCGATHAEGFGAADEYAAPGSIEVTGAVGNSFSATIDEMVAEATETLVLGCSCAGNPADGAASVNAEVTGIAVGTLLAVAEPSADANTIVFTSADGYEIALPLSYVMQRYCPIVFDVNGSPLIESVGGTNQLWLGSTSARYFARDIVRITLEERETPPPAPGSDEAGDEYANLPNVGVYFGGEVR